MALEQDPSGRRRPASIAEFLFAEMRQAVQDIRQKVVEEGWFGRVVTAAPVIEADHDSFQTRTIEPEHRPTFEELWGPRVGSDAAEHTRDQELGLDR